jgi:hypothetical protein
MWNAVVGSGYDQLEEPEQMALIADLQNLTTRGLVPAAETMKLLPRVGRDPEPWIRSNVYSTELQLANAAPQVARERYTDWLQKMMRVDPPAAQQGASIEEFLKSQSSASGATKP